VFCQRICIRGTTFAAVLTLMFVAPTAHAQESTAAPRWGVEVDLVQPFIPEVHIVTLKGMRTLTGSSSGAHGDLMLGIYARPNISHDVVTRISEYMGSVGYRQFLTRGLHAEAQYYAGYVWGERNRIDRRNYSGFVHFAELNAGYRFSIGRGDARRLYLAPQVGYLQGLNRELIIGPRNGKADGFVQGKLLVGVSF
jgi:hypothetical protein